MNNDSIWPYIALVLTAKVLFLALSAFIAIAH